MEKFSFQTKIVCGSGAIAELESFHAKRLFLVTDPFFAKNGTAQKVAAAAKAEQTAIFDSVYPDPSVELAAEGTAKLTEFQPDLLVALGGGSTMDCAKAMAYFSQGTFPFAAIPTTSGSGSEVTDFAILTHEGIKHPLVDSRLRPDMAILDSDLLQELPRPLIADAGFDVITHAVEAYTATGHTTFSDLFALEAFRSAFACLPASYAGRTEVRPKIHLAAAMAGMAFTEAGLGLCHALSHTLGGRFHVPHGRLNAILLPAVISTNAHAALPRYAGLSRAAGMGGSADTIALRNLKSGLTRLRKDLDLPETLAQVGISPREIWDQRNSIVESVLADPCCRTNPMNPEDFQIRRILEEVSGHV